MKKLILLTVLLLCKYGSFADEPYWAMNISAGANFFGTSHKDLDIIRATTLNEFRGKTTNIGSSYNLSFTPEYYLTNWFSFATGLCISRTKGNYKPWVGNFLYFKSREDGYDTYYYRIASIEEKSVYVGIPLEFKLTIRGSHRPTPYVRIGATPSFRCRTALMVYEYQQKKSQHSYTVINTKKIPQPDKFIVPVYLASGFQFGHEDSYCVEVTFPYIVARGSISGLQDCGNLGGGFRLTYQFSKIRQKD